MNEILETVGADLMPLITNLAISIITAIFGLLGYQLNKLIKKYKDNEVVKEIQGLLERNKEVVRTSVEYVEQIGKHLEAEEKFELAKDKAVELANSKGFSISDAELDVLIEQAVGAFKKELNKTDIIIPDTVIVPEENVIISEQGMTSPEDETTAP